MNTKLHAVTDSVGRPIRFFISAGQVSDYTGARALVNKPKIASPISREFNSNRSAKLGI